VVKKKRKEEGEKERGNLRAIDPSFGEKTGCRGPQQRHFSPMSFACIETVLSLSLSLSFFSFNLLFIPEIQAYSHSGYARFDREPREIKRKRATTWPWILPSILPADPSFPYLSPKTIPGELRPLRQDRAQDLTLTGNYR